jgi:hypothetical protein
MTLDLFFEDDFKPFTDTHVEALKGFWKKMEPSHKLFGFNREWYTRHFQNYSDKELIYHAGLGVPHYSEWAAEVAIERGILQDT